MSVESNPALNPPTRQLTPAHHYALRDGNHDVREDSIHFLIAAMSHGTSFEFGAESY